ncbi:MAG: HAD-IIIC family phosphatase [Caulobacteraceae bacterium]
MRAFSLGETGDSSFALDPRLYAELKATRTAIAERSVLFWDEHCSECAMPNCFASCSLYTPRPDFKCRRFDRGLEMARATSPRERAIRLMSVAFRRWGKLEAKGAIHLVDARRAGLSESLGAAVQRMADTPLAPASVRRKLGKGVDLLTAGALKIASGGRPPEMFVLEAINPGEARVDLTFTVRPASTANGGQFHQARAELAPGYNRLCFPAGEILARVGEVSSLLFQIEPVDSDAGTGPLLFGLVDFVSLKAGARLATSRPGAPATEDGAARPKVKCVVWDLDNTLWRGTLIEDGAEGVRFDERVPELISELDRRGILNSIASKNAPEDAEALLRRAGLWEFFLHPQIHWNPKSGSVAAIAAALNIGMDSLALIDDQAFERGEVAAAHPAVEVFDVDFMGRMLSHPRFDVIVTDESRNRRAMYLTEEVRREALEDATGDYDAYLRSCAIGLTIETLEARHLNRAFELTERTNQLNYSGRRLSRGDLESLMVSPDHQVLVLSASDRFGDYGLIGVALLNVETWTVESFFMSCRVQRKKVEHAFFERLLRIGRARGKPVLSVTYRPTPRNEPSRVVLEDEMGFQRGPAEGDCQAFQLLTDASLPESDIVVVDDRSALAGGAAPERARA